jgi:hypothetical protein
MVQRLTRLFFAVVMAFAFIGSGMAPLLPSTCATSPSMTMADAHDYPCEGMMIAHGQNTAPGKPALPGCMTDLGCLLAVGIPATPPRIAGHVAWARVAYWSRPDIVRGITSKPAIGPPIRRV